VIPARGGSKSYPLKNIALLSGKPLLHYALSAALKAKLVNRVVVSSEHPGVLEIAETYGENIALERPEFLAHDNMPSLPVAVHALEMCEKDDNCRYDYVILVQVTNPLVIPEDVDHTLERLMETNCDSCVTVVSMGYLHPSKFKTLKDDGLLPYIEEEEVLVPRQQLQEVYIRNGSCYAVKRSILLRGSLVGNDVRAVVVPKERYIDINDSIDLQIAECLLSDKG
jgi:CMP-N-acetylneuraminic acid synthetase